MLMQQPFTPISGTTYQRKHTCTLHVGCPTCGRPACVRSEFIGTKLACGHCGGTIIVRQQLDGRSVAQSTTHKSLESQSLSSERHAHDPESARTPKAPTQHPPKPKRAPVARERSRPVAFVVEPRDEVFARLAGDLIESGYRVVRALTVTGAIKACVKYRPVLVIASLSLPGKAAWRMAPKLAMIDAKTRVWLYGHFIATHDYAMADFLGIEHLIECSGDLFRLSLQVRESLIDDRGTMMDRHGCQRI